MVYATFSKGFRPGGVNRDRWPDTACLTSPITSRTTRSAGRPSGWTSACGGMARSSGRTGRTSNSPSWCRPASPQSPTPGNARIKGVENELTFQPDNNLTLSVNFTWLHAYLMQNFCQTTGVTDCPNDTAYAPFQPPSYTFTGPFALAGTDLPQVPKFKGNAIARYQFGDIASWRPFGQASVVYQTQTASNLKQNEQNIVGFTPSWYQLDLSGGATHNDTQVTLYITNVTDKRGAADAVCQYHTGPRQPDLRRSHAAAHHRPANFAELLVAFPGKRRGAPPVHRAFLFCPQSGRCTAPGT